MTTKKKTSVSKPTDDQPDINASGQQVANPLPAAETSAGEHTSAADMPADMQAYFDNYPENNVFYRTSDGQVFLENNKNNAENHQRSLKEGSVETIKKA